ncbi:hypothetical protein GUITHDRAFT_69232 [Guillardia theta CCMP2712]|uniref:Guanylate cyclase domain-containing protein n=1 Tax=Guillardia theta (strain CCMP2712) TaxID=905079 RepID=L1JHB7_GUITC|nr:hypothetical protein GUITHDRAFT_69232 [Guillardia theta CCMP2712]EKX47908.1 hypothetical protein GUITHDRAFT_69232 [Guillardia theta CCMP2712]|eukprot:XP_005834888.1 hypothetical protein GUITHDRAFT_69232 [Guillardia theta CCMP2712]
MAEDPLEPLHTARHKHPKIAKIEHGLISLAQLLQLGFGEAGARVISRSLRSGSMCGVDVNNTGTIINAFFGFCDIRNFTDLTEVLQADVVKVVNNVGRIVHGNVTRNHGAPNKNIGDAFLLVWKPKGDVAIQEVADSALRSYIQSILEISRDRRLLYHTSRKEVQERMPGYSTTMGFGLHFGWAIECTIGSRHKLDASYLSPHVNMAARLEQASKQYGVPILISGDVFGLLSKRVQVLCRFVDRVTVKGSNAPVELYTFDVPEQHQREGG